MLSPTFSTYKVNPVTQDRRDYTHGLTLSQARDVIKYPLGLQHDKVGAYVWSYKQNAGGAF